MLCFDVFTIGHPVRFFVAIIWFFGQFFVLLLLQKKEMAKEYILKDKELGNLHIRVNVRARRLTFRTKEDAIYVTVPPNTLLNEIKNAIEKLRPRLKASVQKTVRPLIDLNYRIDTGFFKLDLVSGSEKCFLSRSEPGKTQIVCPPDADFSHDALQAFLHKVIQEALRRNAKVILPSRLQMLATQHHLSYKSVKINSSSGRWGSCSSCGNINLSFYLLLLPRHLVDYVLLHELSHTREMNHGEQFWALLDRLTGNKAQVLKEELKQYRTMI